MHGLSGLPQDIAFEPDGSISLRFLPDFLAKNQVPGDPSPCLSIRPLTAILAPDDPDRKLCPVRALRRYIRFARAIRGPTQRRLFISINSDYNKDISRSTISRWLCSVVKMAYGGTPGVGDAPSVRAHEIRAWSSSLAFAHSRSLREVLDAAYWRSEDPFINFYLRDVARLREDGSHGIASAVVAQHCISARASR